MGSPTSLLAGARAFARDFPRDQMPRGYLWDVADYVPAIIDANLTGRGGWIYGSDVLGGDIETGIYAPYSNGDKLLVQTDNSQMYDIDPLTGAILHGPTPIVRGVQNPILFNDTVIFFDGSSASAPKLVTNPGGVPTVTAIATGHKAAPIGCVRGRYYVSAGAPGETNVVRFSDPAHPLTDPLSYDDASLYKTARQVTGLQAMRSVILVFHKGMVERFRGATPVFTGAQPGESDMFLESLFDRAGCTDPLTIATWNDNTVFADEHGVHVTDGSVIRNLVSQGGILTYWRTIWTNKQSLCASTFLDYYILTIRRTDGSYWTLVVDLNKRNWFRFTNINALTYISSSSGLGMERIWAGYAGRKRLARISPCFFPVFTTTAIQDDDGTPVLPTFETPWYRMTQEEGRKRVRFAYLSYDVRAPGDAPNVEADAFPGGWRRQIEDGELPHADELALRAVQQTMQLGYIRSPQQLTYTTLGVFPTTNGYTRYRLPIGQFPYGVAFKVQQLLPSNVTRIFDLGVEAQAAERSRV